MCQVVQPEESFSTTGVIRVHIDFGVLWMDWVLFLHDGEKNGHLSIHQRNILAFSPMHLVVQPEDSFPSCGVMRDHLDFGVL